MEIYMKALNIRFRPETVMELDLISAEMNRSRSEVARAAIAIGIKHMQDEIEKCNQGEDCEKRRGLLFIKMLRGLFI